VTELDAGIAISFGARTLRDKAETGQASLEHLYDQYAHALFRYALALVGSPEDAEDAVQEVFVRIAGEQKRSESIANVKAYLFAATRNAAYSILRSRRRRARLEQAMCAESEAGHPEEASARLSRSSVLREVFAELPIEQREVLVLKIFDEMTFKEIAETVGASINTVGSRYRYGIERLRQALEEEHDG